LEEEEMGVVNLETVDEEDLGILLNATKVALNISSSSIEVANSSQEYEEDLYRAFSFWIEGIAVTLVSIFGIVGMADPIISSSYLQIP
jgi:hypothetical protein